MWEPLRVVPRKRCRALVRASMTSSALENKLRTMPGQQLVVVWSLGAALSVSLPHTLPSSRLLGCAFACSVALTYQVNGQSEEELKGLSSKQVTYTRVNDARGASLGVTGSLLSLS